jgi:hypothetical protein
MLKVVTFIIMLFSLRVLTPASEAQSPWQVTPLVTKTTPVPDSGGTFQEFGETYVSERFLAFWARFGPSQDKDWALYSWKDGRLTRIAVHDVQFATPDSRQIRLMHTPKYFHGGISLMHASPRFLYLSAGVPDHIYGWDGDRWQSVLCDGDTLDVGGVKHTIHRAHILDTDARGRALVYWDSSRPKANGWAIYDGSSWKPLFKEGDALPGTPGVTIKNLSCGLSCIDNCLPEPKLLEDGSILGIMTVVGAPYKTALFRINGDKAEKILAEDELVTVGEQTLKARLGRILAANATSLAMDFPEVTITYYTDPYTFRWTARTRLRIFVLHQGKASFIEGFGLREGKASLVEGFGLRELKILGLGTGLFTKMMEVRIDSAEFPTPGSPGLLFTLRLAKGKSGLATWTLLSFPGLYYWNGEKAEPLEWERAAGVSTDSVLELLQRKLSRLFTINQAYGLSLFTLPPQAGGVRVDLPPVGSAPRVWLFPLGTNEPKLAAAPRFTVDGNSISDTDILAWQANGEAIARSDDGLFLLRRTAR